MGIEPMMRTAGEWWWCAVSTVTVPARGGVGGSSGGGACVVVFSGGDLDSGTSATILTASVLAALFLRLLFMKMEVFSWFPVSDSPWFFCFEVVVMCGAFGDDERLKMVEDGDDDL
ncbi:hypothetical protein A2U01_0030959 [Trifolium medium]|uniref:Uncharacterized protein n=1 Tax=Trifolium medium TaxID=97028 RepID=A0A392PCP3_9FABA|nr:hypothetical protein [Trifolium medium]